MRMRLTRYLGTCTVQILINAEFWGVEHETASWIDMWGPARALLQQCVRVKKLGGLVPQNGLSLSKNLVDIS